MSTQPFSQRHGLRGAAAQITIRGDAPQDVRDAILMIAEGEVRLSPGMIRSPLCAVLRRVPDPNNWTNYPNVWEECQYLMRDAPWYKVYDFVELMYERLIQSDDPARA